ncbi:hypothetical protein QNM99_29455 [Pseudomonas sp. PCH446]
MALAAVDGHGAAALGADEVVTVSGFDIAGAGACEDLVVAGPALTLVKPPPLKIRSSPVPASMNTVIFT